MLGIEVFKKKYHQDKMERFWPNQAPEPLWMLNSRAKEIMRLDNISLAQALDKVARTLRFDTWAEYQADRDYVDNYTLSNWYLSLIHI